MVRRGPDGLLLIDGVADVVGHFLEVLVCSGVALGVGRETVSDQQFDDVSEACGGGGLSRCWVLAAGLYACGFMPAPDRDMDRVLYGWKVWVDVGVSAGVEDHSGEVFRDVWTGQFAHHVWVKASDEFPVLSLYADVFHERPGGLDDLTWVTGGLAIGVSADRPGGCPGVGFSQIGEDVPVEYRAVVRSDEHVSLGVLGEFPCRWVDEFRHPGDELPHPGSSVHCRTEFPVFSGPFFRQFINPFVGSLGSSLVSRFFDGNCGLVMCGGLDVVIDEQDAVVLLFRRYSGVG